MSDSHTEEHCPRCAVVAVKGVANFQVDKLCLTTGAGISTTEYNPGLGCYTESTRHAERIASRRGLEPIGTEPVDKLHKTFEKKREEKREERWRQADRVMVYE
jgi:hypothetical protein